MSFWKTIIDYWKDVVIMPDFDDMEDVTIEEPKDDEKEKLYRDHANKYDGVMRSIDNKLKAGFPVKSGFSLIVTTRDTATKYLENSNLQYKLRCMEPADKQFIVKHLNYDKLILTVSNAEMLEMFNNILLPSTETVRCVNPHDYTRPGDIICFMDNGFLYVFQYRGDYLTDEEILNADFGTSILLENNGPSAMKLSYIRSMLDNNLHIVYKPYITWIDILEQVTKE